MKKGDIILIWFPFSDFSSGKYRPCIIMQVFESDIILCPLTTQNHPKSIKLDSHDLDEGAIAPNSQIKYWKVTTIAKKQVVKTIARLSEDKLKQVTKIFQDFF